MSITSDRLKELRKKNGYTQNHVCESVMPQGKYGNKDIEKVLSNYENGRRKPDYETLVEFAKFYEVSTDYLLGKSGYENETSMSVSELIGLSENAIKAIMWFKDNETTHNINQSKHIRTINAMLSGMNFINLVISISKYSNIDGGELFFVRNADSPHSSAEKLDEDETINFRKYKLNNIISGYVEEVIERMKQEDIK